jgi:HEAT repeat protein
VTKRFPSLQDIGDKRAIPSLWPLLADPDENIREEAQDAIDSLGNRDAN